jgi:hypothetical protein
LAKFFVNRKTGDETKNAALQIEAQRFYNRKQKRAGKCASNKM